MLLHSFVRPFEKPSESRINISEGAIARDVYRNSTGPLLTRVIPPLVANFGRVGPHKPYPPSSPMFPSLPDLLENSISNEISKYVIF